MRDGIRLVSDLRNGNLDVLFELFPWVRAEFLEYMASMQPQKSEAESAIAEQLSRIEELLSSDKTLSPVTIGEGRGGSKKMAVPHVAAPVFDDDDDSPLLAVTKAKAAGSASQNFLNSAFKLVQ